MGKGLSTMACHERQLYILYWMVHRQWSEVWERVAASASSPWIQSDSVNDGPCNNSRGGRNQQRGSRGEDSTRDASVADHGHGSEHPDGYSSGRRAGYQHRRDKRGWPGYATKDTRNGHYYAPAPPAACQPDIDDHGNPMLMEAEEHHQQNRHQNLTAQPSVEPTRTLCESACSFCQSCENLANHQQSDADDEHETCGSSESDGFNASCYRYGCREQHGKVRWAESSDMAVPRAPETESSGVFEYSSAGACCSSCPEREDEGCCTSNAGQARGGASGDGGDEGWCCDGYETWSSSDGHIHKMRYNSVDGKWREVFTPPKEEFRQPQHTPEEYAHALRCYASTSLTNYYLRSNKKADPDLSASTNGLSGKPPKKLSSAKQWLMHSKDPNYQGKGSKNDLLWSNKNSQHHHSDLHLNLSSSGLGGGLNGNEYVVGRFANVSDLLRSLRGDVKLAHPSFVDEFITQPRDGVGLLLDILKQIQLSQTDCTVDCRLGAKQQHACLVRTLTDEFECLSAMLSCCAKQGADQEGARAQLAKRRDGSGLYALAVCLMSNVNKSRILATELLCLACDHADSGHEQVLEAISTLRLRFGEPIRFKFLVGMLSSFGSPEFQVGCMRLLNTLVETAGSAREKAYLQAEMEEAGLEVANIRNTVPLNSGEANLLHKELDRWEKNYIDVGSIVGKLDLLARENMSLKERVTLAEQRWRLMERERDALIAAEENLKSKCQDLEKKLGGLKPLNTEDNKRKLNHQKHSSNGTKAKPFSDHSDDSGSMTSLTETEYDVQAMEAQLSPKKPIVDSKTIVKRPASSDRLQNIKQQANKKRDGLISSDESFYAEKNITKETMTIKNPTVIVKSADASTSSSSSGRGTTVSQQISPIHRSTSPTVVSDSASSYYNEEDIVPRPVRHPPPPVSQPRSRQRQHAFCFDEFEVDQDRIEELPPINGHGGRKSSTSSDHGRQIRTSPSHSQKNGSDHQRSPKRLQQTEEHQMIAEEIQRALQRGQQKHLKGKKRDHPNGTATMSSSGSSLSGLSDLTAYQRKGAPERNNIMMENSDTESCQSPKDPDIESRGSISLRTTVESESTKSFVGGYLKPNVRRSETFDGLRQPDSINGLRRSESFQYGLALPKAPNNKNMANGGQHGKGFWPKLFSFGESMSVAQIRPSGPSDYSSYLVYDPEIDEMGRRRDGREKQRSKPASRRSSASSSRSGTKQYYNNDVSPKHSNQHDIGERRNRGLSLSQSNLLDADDKTDNWTIKWRYPKVGAAESNGKVINEGTFVINKEKNKGQVKQRQQIPPDGPMMRQSNGIYLPQAGNQQPVPSKYPKEEDFQERLQQAKKVQRSQSQAFPNNGFLERQYYPSPAASAVAAAAAAQLAASGSHPIWLQRRHLVDSEESMRTFDIPTPDYSTMGSSPRTVIHHHEIITSRVPRVLDIPAGLY